MRVCCSEESGEGREIEGEKRNINLALDKKSCVVPFRFV